MSITRKVIRQDCKPRWLSKASLDWTSLTNSPTHQAAQGSFRNNGDVHLFLGMKYRAIEGIQERYVHQAQ